MNRRLSSLVLLFPLLTGCHVIERARQCKQLVKLVQEAAPEIGNTAVGDDPNANSIRKKARLYGQLGTKVEGVSFRSAELEKEKNAFSSSLKSLEKHLSEAATAVDNETASKKHSRDTVATDTHPAAPTAPAVRRTLTPAPRIPTPTRSTLHNRRYLQAKRAAENAGRAMTLSAKRLTKACH